MKKLISLLTMLALLLAVSPSFAAPPDGKGGGGGNDGGGSTPFAYSSVYLGEYPGGDDRTTTWDLNDFGEVAASAGGTEVNWFAVYWSADTGWLELESFLSQQDQDDWFLKEAWGINNPDPDTGRPTQICGTGEYLGQPAAYRMTLTADAATIEPIGLEPGIQDAGALAINNQGDLAMGVIDDTGQLRVGYYSDDDLNGDGLADGLQVISAPEIAGNSYVKDINLLGQVVGYYRSADGEWLGFRFTPGDGLESFLLPTADGTCGSSRVNDSNDLGEVCGRSETVVQVNKKKTACEVHAIIATSESDVSDLGLGGTSVATGINNSGDIVGGISGSSYLIDSAGFIIDGASGVAYDLNSLITDGGQIDGTPRAINELGDVLGADTLLLRTSAQ